jgi:ankyrin repeat protein
MNIQGGADVNGCTPLHHAVKDDDSRVHLLIAAGANVNARDNEGKTPLHALHGMKNANVVEVMIAAGANVNARDNEGKTPLHAPHGMKNANVVEVMIAAGANVNARDNEGKTPLHGMKNANVVEVMIAAGADVNARDNEGKTPLHFTILSDVARAVITLDPESCYDFLNDHTKILLMLKTAGADMDARDNRGMANLHILAREYVQEYANAGVYMRKEFALEMMALIIAGANVNIQDFEGNTPLHYLPMNHHDNPDDGPSDDEEFCPAQVLVEEGACISIKNKDGKTPRAIHCCQPLIDAIKKQKELREQAAKIIQKGCESWLWKPVCRDGKPGIHAKMLMEHCTCSIK